MSITPENVEDQQYADLVMHTGQIMRKLNLPSDQPAALALWDALDKQYPTLSRDAKAWIEAHPSR